MAKCRSCGLAIEWCQTKDRKMIPMDVNPIEGGNMVVVHDGSQGEGLARARTSEDVDAGLPPRVSHFATCPNAGQHRRKK